MKWEYKIVVIENDEELKDLVSLQEKFNEYGSNGWEVVEILRKQYKGGNWIPETEKDFIVLKRACN